ncbi:hypothetical protein Rsub_12682 [Raphidocelis subcapitata]|uniref:Uncharacterized protein n=1 Tax=Raphidocelis subcapitata TaxID=307507 RepID=A0A2V0PJJ0_9CHLO|nr:hypothetical protein Rsub_12682 [Raphidocelis subcapitata]|eukprot:GBF99886.1 hypothetical protein Rsub_12682 [Raphidocelis subcapitata]
MYGDEPGSSEQGGMQPRGATGFDGGGGGGGGESTDGGGRARSGWAAAAPPPTKPLQPALLSLRLPTAADEEQYWRQAGTLALARQDAWALLYTAFNVAMGYALTAEAESTATVPSLVNTCLDATSLILFVAAILGRAWLAVNLPSYCRHRTVFAAANRAARSVFMLTFFTQMSVDGWRDFVLHPKPGAPPQRLAPPAAASVLLKSLTLSSTYFVMHALLFPLRLTLAAPLHAAFCLAAWPALRKFACMVRADPELLLGARVLCERLQWVNNAALLIVGETAPAPDAACRERPLELLVPLFCALSCLGTLYVLYERELAHKLSYLRGLARSAATAAGATPAAAAAAAVLSLPGELASLRRLAGAAVVVLASFAAGEAAAQWAAPYDCAAA